jgi:putative chitinase
VQLTWRENYARADKELGLTGDASCEWHAENALRLDVAAACLFEGLVEGWYRTHEDGDPETLGRYFNDDADDPIGARECVNGDANKVPSWSSGASIGELIRGYHHAFLMALEKSWSEDEAEPVPGPELVEDSRRRRRWRA